MSDLSPRIGNLFPEKHALFELRFMKKDTAVFKEQEFYHFSLYNRSLLYSPVLEKPFFVK